VAGLNNPSSLAVDSTNVYWTDVGDGTVVKADLATGTQTQIASGESSPTALFIDSSSNLYWVETSAGNVHIMRQDGVSGVYASGQAGPTAVVATTDTVDPVYWSTRGTIQGGAIMTLPPQGPPAGAVASLTWPVEKLALPPEWGSVGFVASSQSAVLLVDPFTQPVNPIPLAANNPGIGGIAADATYAY
jgi:hypothetical protein